MGDYNAVDFGLRDRVYSGSMFEINDFFDLGDGVDGGDVGDWD